MSLASKMRNDIRETRATLKKIANLSPDREIANNLYNIAIKAFLRGYYKGVQRVKEELSDVESK